jgi:hypothetical protein
LDENINYDDMSSGFLGQIFKKSGAIVGQNFKFPKKGGSLILLTT